MNGSPTGRTGAGALPAGRRRAGRVRRRRCRGISTAAGDRLGVAVAAGLGRAAVSAAECAGLAVLAVPAAPGVCVHASPAQRVYQRGCRAFAAARGIALPPLRHAIRAAAALHEFLQLRHTGPRRSGSRWSTRRVGTSAAVLVAAILLAIALANVPAQQRRPGDGTACHQHGLPHPATTAGRGPVGTDSQRSGVHPAAAARLDPEPGPGAARHNGHHARQRRAGSGILTLTLTRHCTARRAAAVRAPGPGIRRQRAPGGGARFAATWHDTFPGGCVQIALRPAAQQAAVDQGLARAGPGDRRVHLPRGAAAHRRRAGSLSNGARRCSRRPRPGGRPDRGEHAPDPVQEQPRPGWNGWRHGSRPPHGLFCLLRPGLVGTSRDRPGQ